MSIQATAMFGTLSLSQYKHAGKLLEAKEIEAMTLNRMVAPALSGFLGATGFCMAQASGQSQEAPRLTAYAQDRGSWDAPPQELQEIQRKGFQDGIEGARKDRSEERRVGCATRYGGST